MTHQWARYEPLDQPQPQRRRRDIPTPEEERDFLSLAASKLVSGIGTIGKVLDFPGALVRGLIAEGRLTTEVTGQDIVKMLGYDPDTVAGWLAGFGIEILTNPLTYVTFPGPLVSTSAKTLTEAGKIVQRAGLLPKLPLVAARELPHVTVWGKVAPAGPHTAKLQLNLGKFIPHLADDEVKLLATAAGVKADDAAQLTTALASKYGPEVLVSPLGYPAVFFDIPVASLELAKRMDALARGIKYAPFIGPAIRKHFSRYGGAATPMVGELAPYRFHRAEQIATEHISRATKFAEDIAKLGYTEEHLRTALESKLDDIADPKLRDIVKTLREQYLEPTLKTAQQIGIPIRERVNYFPRHGLPGMTRLPATIAREELIQDLPTQKLREMFSDPELLKARAELPVEDFAKWLEQKHGSWIPSTYRPYGATEAKPRFPDLASYIKRFDEETLRRGVFPHTFDVDLIRYASEVGRAIGHRTALQDILTTPGLATIEKAGPVGHGAMTLAELADTVKVTLPIPRELAQRFVVPPESVEEIVRPFRQLLLAREVRDSPWEKLTQMWRTGVITRLNFHVRNRMSGMVQNAVHEGILPGSKFDRMARDLIEGRLLDPNDFPVIRDAVLAKGRKDVAEAVTEEVRRLAFASGMPAAHHQFGAEGAMLTGIQAIPGRQPMHYTDVLKPLQEPHTLKEWLAFPMVRGAFSHETRWVPAQMGEIASAIVESRNRLPVFLKHLASGESPAQAAWRAMELHIPYQAQFWSPTERLIAAALVPFYKFTAHQTRLLASELSKHPGAPLGLAGLIKLQSALQRGAIAPPHVSQTLAIPVQDVLGAPEGGGTRYITGFGLMHEPAAAIVGGGPVGGTLEVLSALHPFIKAPFELATGQLFFQRGPTGARPISEAEPALGRIAAYMAGADRPYRLPMPLEYAATSVLPVAPFITTTRQLFDPRKAIEGTRIPGPAALLPVVTGVRVTDVPVQAQEALVRKTLEDVIRRRGGRRFETFYMPAERLQELPPEQRQEIEEVLDYLSELGRRARKRIVERGRM